MRRQSAALIAAGCAAFAAGWLVWRPELWFWLSWLSFWLYSASYLCFIFVGLGRRAFFALCILAAAAIIPQLLIDGNHPVLVVQVLWIVFSAVGLVRRDLAV